MLRNLPKPMQQRYRRSTTLQWPDLQSPQAILDNISQNYRFEIYGSEQVPWDLWAHATIPQTSVIEQLTLVLIQFDLTFQWQNEGSEVHLVPIPRDDYAQLQQKVRIPSARAQPLHNPGTSRGAYLVHWLGIARKTANRQATACQRPRPPGIPFGNFAPDT